MPDLAAVEQLLQRRLLGVRLLQHQGDITDPESRFDRSLVEPRLCHGMDVASQDYRPAGVNRRRDAVWLRQRERTAARKRGGRCGTDASTCIITTPAGGEDRLRYRMAYELSTFM